MTDTEKFYSWNIALKEQGYQPIFNGDREAAQKGQEMLRELDEDNS